MTEEKVSAIIPTILKNTQVLGKVLNILDKDIVISEILLINNSGKTITEFNDIKKLSVYNSKQNMYVNPSWNFGVDNIKNDIFLIINDDILPINNFAKKVIESGILDKKVTGLIGINPQYINQSNRLTTKTIEIPNDDGSNLFFTAMNNFMHTGDWGSAFFGRKKNYYNIPEDLRIIYGDNYLLKKNLDNAKINYQISGIPFNHIHSLSSASPEFASIIETDIKIQSKYLH